MTTLTTQLLAAMHNYGGGNSQSDGACGLLSLVLVVQYLSRSVKLNKDAAVNLEWGTTGNKYARYRSNTFLLSVDMADRGTVLVPNWLQCGDSSSAFYFSPSSIQVRFAIAHLA